MPGIVLKLERTETGGKTTKATTAPEQESVRGSITLIMPSNPETQNCSISGGEETAERTWSNSSQHLSLSNRNLLECDKG